MIAREHKKILASLFFFVGVMTAFSWIMFGGWYSGEWFLLAYGIFYMITGSKLYNDKPQADILGVVASLLCILSFPIGTIIGIYGMWYFVIGRKKDI